MDIRSNCEREGLEYLPEYQTERRPQSIRWEVLCSGILSLTWHRTSLRLQNICCLMYSEFVVNSREDSRQQSAAWRVQVGFQTHGQTEHLTWSSLLLFDGFRVFFLNPVILSESSTLDFLSHSRTLNPQYRDCRYMLNNFAGRKRKTSNRMCQGSVEILAIH